MSESAAWLSPHMLFPISRDAPIYYWPFATVGLIILNVAAFLMMIISPDMSTPAGIISDLVLVHGTGIHPMQWLTNIFMHADPMHLIGNMLFLWIFGLVVEGKLGWWKFLLVYLGVGIFQSAMVQIMMLGVAEPSVSLGASSAIYAIMAITVIWAPKNEINCFYWFFFIVFGKADVPVLMFAAIYLAFDLLGMTMTYTLSGSAMSTGLLHLTGALVGVPVGLFLLQRKWVDCEGWDLISLWRGGGSPVKVDLVKIDTRIEGKKRFKEHQQLEQAREQLDLYLQNKNLTAAKVLVEKMRHVGDGLQLDRGKLNSIIRGLHTERRWADSAPFMAELVQRFPKGSDLVRIKLAQICTVELQRPARALELLQAVDYQQQPEANIALAKKIARKAKQMQAEGVVELENDL
jgi:membrane associated rhomboid family serine protease